MALMYGQLAGASGFSARTVTVDSNGRLITSTGVADPLADGSTAVTGSDAIVIDVGGAMPLVWVSPNSATVSVEYSTDGGNSYTDWSHGDVTDDASTEFVVKLTHLRLTKVSGTSFTYGVL